MTNEFYLFQGEKKDKDTFCLPVHYNLCIYEVVRVNDGVILFCEDHMKRLFHSLKKKNIHLHITPDRVISELYSLVQYNAKSEGNIRYDIYVYENKIERWAYFIPHFYPPIEWYTSGVDVVSLRDTRQDPSFKSFHKEIRKKTELLLNNSKAYEVILIENNGYITEGSKSNIFFIKNETLYTAPDDKVLSGITRKKVLQCIERLSLPVKYELVKYDEIKHYDAAFLTGTSPKVLPIKKFDDISFNPKHRITQILIKEYDQLIEEYIALHGNKKM